MDRRWTTALAAMIPTLSVVVATDPSAGRVVPSFGAALPAAVGVGGPILKAVAPNPQD